MSTKNIKTMCILLGSYICFSFISCKNDTIFYAENKTVIDTMFMNRNKILTHEMDSLCILDEEDIFQYAFDSIYELRVEMIKKELAKSKEYQ